MTGLVPSSSVAASPEGIAEALPSGGTARSSPVVGEPDVILDVDHVTAGYGEAPVLRDVSFAVRRGEVVALLGPNGCGKTTLLRIVGKLLPATAGSVRVTGREVGAMSQLELSRTLATVSQVQRTTFPFSVLDILLTGRLPYVSVFASPRESDVRICRDVLDRFGIRHLEQTPITRLSGGERQLVMIARALAQEPRVLLLDEPTTYLDLRNQVRVLETIANLARSQELSVLMTIHDPNQALAYADGCVLLRKLAALEGIDPATAVGPAVADRTSTVAAGEPATVLSPEHVQEAYGMAVDLISHGRRRLIIPLE